MVAYFSSGRVSSIYSFFFLQVFRSTLRGFYHVIHELDEFFCWFPTMGVFVIREGRLTCVL